ncbi:MAG TPA: polyprenyl synthetase family protein [Chloroflexota bacterium]
MNPTSTIFEIIQPELQRVDEVLAEAAKTDHWLLGVALSHLLPGKGKRIRPSLALLAGKFHNFDDEKIVTIAAAVEMLHTASLVHDDVVDGAEERRGAPTLFTRVGNAVAVLAGDYLFAKSAAYAASTNNLEVIARFADTVMTMCQGQIDEANRAPDVHLSLTRESYFRTIYSKTASLFVLACESGAILSGAPQSTVDALRDYGRDLGLAFQVIDDILDFVGDEQVLGKPVGSDLRHGVVTLPLIYLREEVPLATFRAAFESDDHGEDVVARVLDLLHQSNAIERSYEEARRLATRAMEHLDGLPSNGPHEALRELARYVVERTW